MQSTSGFNLQSSNTFLPPQTPSSAASSNSLSVGQTTPNAPDASSSTPSWLETGHPLNLTLNGQVLPLLAMVAGNAFGSDIFATELSFEETLAFFTQALGAYEKTQPLLWDTLKPALKMIQSAYDMQKEITQFCMEGQESHVMPLVEKLWTAIANSDEGVCIPLTTYGTQKALCIAKKDNFTIINIDLDLEKHHQKISAFQVERYADRELLEQSAAEEIRYQKFITYDRIKPEAYRTFLKTVLEMEKGYAFNTLATQTEQLYNVCDLLEGKKRSPLDPNAFPQAYRKLPRGGNSWGKNIQALISLQCSRLLNSPKRAQAQQGAQIYKQAKVLWQSHLLHVAYKWLAPCNEIQHHERNLFLDIAANLRQALRKLHLDNAPLSSEQELGLTKSLDAIEQWLQKPQLIPFRLIEIPNKVSNHPLNDSVQFKQIYPSNHPTNPIQAQDAEPTLTKALALFTQKKDLNQTTPLKNRLKSLAAFNRISDIQTSYTLAPLFYQLIAEIPLPQHGVESVWDNFNAEERIEVLDQLHQIMELSAKLAKRSPAGYNFVKQIGNGYFSDQAYPIDCYAEGMICNYTCLACIDTLTRKHHPDFFAEAPPTSGQRLWAAIQDPTFKLISSTSFKRVCELLFYYATPKERADNSSSPQWEQYILTKILSRLAETDTKLWAKTMGEEEHKGLFSFMIPSSLHDSQTPLTERVDARTISTAPTQKHLLSWILNHREVVREVKLRHPSLPPEPAHFELVAALMADPWDNPVLPRAIVAMQRAVWSAACYNKTNIAKSAVSLTYEYGNRSIKVAASVPMFHSTYLQYSWTGTISDIKAVPFQYQNEIIAMRQGKDKLLSEKELRELQMIGSDPYDCVNRCLNFFESRMDLLEHKEYQNILLGLFFRVGNLDSQIKDAPQFIERVETWLNHILHHFEEIGKPDHWIKMAQCGAEMLLKFNPNYDLSKIISQLEVELIPKIKGNDTLLQALSIALLLDLKFLRHADHLTTINHQNLFLRYFRLLIAQAKDQNSELIETPLLYSAKHYCNMLWKKRHDTLTIEDASSLFSSLLQPYFPDTRLQLAKYTAQEMKGAGFRLDLTTGIIEVGANQTLEEFPKKMQTPFFLKSCPGKIIHTLKDVRERVIYALTLHHENREYVVTVFQGEDDEIGILRDFNGVWYQAVRKPQQLPRNLQFIFQDDNCYWMEYKGDASKVHLFAVSPEGKFCFSATLTSNQNGTQELIELERQDGNRLAKHNTLPMGFQAHLAKLGISPHSTEMWVDVRGVLKEIYLRDWNIELEQRNDATGTSRLYFKGHNGLFLSPDQSLPTPYENLGIIFQDQKGKKRVLMSPAVLRQQFAKNNGRIKLSIEKVNHNLSVNHILLDWNGSKFKAHTLADQLYLICLHQIAQDHAEAWKLACALNPLKRFNSAEVERLDAIINNVSSHHHPHAEMVQLKLSAIKCSNAIKFPLNNNTYVVPDHVITLYTRYLNQLGNLVDLRLTKFEELFLLDCIIQSETKILRDLPPILAQDVKIFARRKKALETDRIHQSRKSWEIRPLCPFNVSLPESRPYLLDWALCRLWKTFPSFLLPQGVKEILDVQSLHYLFSRNVEISACLPFLAVSNFNLTMFNTHFFSFYQIAQDKSSPHRAQLKVLLTVFKGSTYHKALKQIFESPSDFPSFAELRRLDGERMKEGYYSALTKISLASEIDKLQRDLNLLPETYPWLKAIERLFATKGSVEVKLPDQTIRWDVSVVQDLDASIQQKLALFFEGAFVVTQFEPIKINRKIPLGHDFMTNQKIEKANSELEEYQVSVKPILRYSLKQEQKRTLKDKLNSLSNTVKADLQSLQINLLKEFNHHSEKRGSLFAKGRSQSTLQWDDLLQLCSKGDKKTFYQKTYLDEEQITHIMHGYAYALVLSSRLKQMQRALDLLENSHNPENEHLLAELLLRSRAYAISNSFIDRLQLEESNGLFYRRDQIRKIDEVHAHKGSEISFEAPTGWGKTKAFIPTLNAEKAGDRFIVNFQPASLEWTNTCDLQNQMKNSYQTQIDRFEFDRGTPFTPTGLKHIYEQLLANMHGERTHGYRPLSISPNVLRSLELQLILNLLSLSKEGISTVEHKELAIVSIKILRLCRVKAWATIDEESTNLNPRDRLVYTAGDAKMLPKEHYELIEHFFDCLLEGDIGQQLDIRHNNQSQTYLKNEESIKEAIIHHFIHLLYVDEGKIADFRTFLNSNSPDLPTSLNSLPRESLFLLKGMLKHILPLSMKGQANVNFGLSKLHYKKIKYAISYSGNNQPKENATSPSQPKNIHELLTKTYLLYYSQGIRDDQAVDLIRQLKIQSIKEAVTSRIPVEHTSAWQIFIRIAPDNTIALNNLTEEEMKALAAQIKHHQEAIRVYIRLCVWDQVKHYPQTIVSDAQNFRSMMNQWLGLSATPPTASSLGPDVSFIPMEGTAARALYLMLAKCRAIHLMDNQTGEVFVDKTLEIAKDNRKRCAIIDTGAFFKGVRGQEVAEKVRQRYANDPTIEEIVYYDEESESFVLMNKATGKTMRIDEGFSKPEGRFVYYDQARTLGSDLEWVVDAIGLLLVGLNTTWNEAAQGAGRARKLPLQQSLELLIPSSFREQVFGNEPPTLEKVLAHLMGNLAREEVMNEFLSQKQQINNEIRRPILDSLLGLPLTDKERSAFSLDTPVDLTHAVSIATRHAQIFLSDETCSAEKLYGVTTQDIDPIEDLKHHQKVSMEQLRKQGPSWSILRHIRQRLSGYEARWKELREAGKLPETVRVNLQGGVDAEIIKEIDREQQVDIEQQTVRIKRAAWNWSPKLDLFNTGWESPQISKWKVTVWKVYMAIARVFEKIVRTFLVNSERMLEWGVSGGFLRHFILIGTSSFIGGVAGLGIGLDIVLLTGEAAVSTALLHLLALPFNATVSIALTNYLLSKIESPLKSLLEVPVMHLGDYMSSTLPSRFHPVTKLFSKELLVTNNLYAYLPGSAEEGSEKPFSLMQKPFFRVLVIQDDLPNGEKHLQMMLIDQNDSRYFGERLQNDRAENDGEPRTRKIGLCDVETGLLLSSGANGLTQQELNDQQQYRELLFQARFLSGRIMNDFQDIAKVKAWAAQAGPALLDFYQNHVLGNQLDAQELLPRTPMGRALNQL